MSEGAKVGGLSWMFDENLEALAGEGFAMGSRYFSCLLHEEVGEEGVVSPQ